MKNLFLVVCLMFIVFGCEKKTEEKPIPKGMFSAMDKSKAYLQLVSSAKTLENFYKKFTDANADIETFGPLVTVSNFKKEIEYIFFFMDKDTGELIANLNIDISLSMALLLPNFPEEERRNMIIDYSKATSSLINNLIVHSEKKLQTISVENSDRVGLYFELYKSLKKTQAYYYLFMEQGNEFKESLPVKDFAPQKVVNEFKNNNGKLLQYLDEETLQKIKALYLSIEKDCDENCDVETFCNEKYSEIELINEFVKENHNK